MIAKTSYAVVAILTLPMAMDVRSSDLAFSNRSAARPVKFDAKHFDLHATSMVGAILSGVEAARAKGGREVVLKKLEWTERRVIEEVGWIIVAIGEYVPPGQQYDELLTRIEIGMGDVDLTPETWTWEK